MVSDHPAPPPPGSIGFKDFSRDSKTFSGDFRTFSRYWGALWVPGIPLEKVLESLGKVLESLEQTIKPMEPGDGGAGRLETIVTYFEDFDSSNPGHSNVASDRFCDVLGDFLQFIDTHPEAYRARRAKEVRSRAELHGAEAGALPELREAHEELKWFRWHFQTTEPATPNCVKCFPLNTNMSKSLKSKIQKHINSASPGQYGSASFGGTRALSRPSGESGWGDTCDRPSFEGVFLFGGRRVRQTPPEII